MASTLLRSHMHNDNDNSEMTIPASDYLTHQQQQQRLSPNKGKSVAPQNSDSDEDDDFYAADTTLGNSTLVEGQDLDARRSSFFGGFDSHVDTANSPLDRLAQSLAIQQQELYRSREPSPGPSLQADGDWPPTNNQASSSARPDRPQRHPGHASIEQRPVLPPKDLFPSSSTSNLDPTHGTGNRKPISSFFTPDQAALAVRPDFDRQRSISTPQPFTSSQHERMPSDAEQLAEYENSRDRRPNSFYGLDRPELFSGDSTGRPLNGLPYSARAGASSDRSRSLSSTSRSPSSSTLARQADPDSQPIASYLREQTHLKPGTRASLLTHAKTLELYRANTKKTNDPDVIYEFAIFMLDTAKELADLAGTSYLGASASPESNDSGSSHNSRDDIASLAAPTVKGDRSKSSLMAKSKSTLSALSQSATTTGSSSSDSSVTETPPLTLSTASDPQTAQAHCRAMQLEAAQLLRRIADRGHVSAQAYLGDMYSQGLGLPKGKPDYDRAFPLFVMAGKHGHIEASYRTAQCCEKGWGCRKDNPKAVQWYRKAAIALHPAAMLRLGTAEINGHLGLVPKPREGFKWLKRTAELAESDPPPAASIEALFEIARLHEKGVEHVVFVDFDYAAECLARASELGHAPSAYKLGDCYEYGKMGCPQDSALSIHYYNIAAQQNLSEACFALTAWYLVGSPGVLPQSDTEAYLWAKRAANQGLAKAEYAMGYFTEFGIGTHKDMQEAMLWYSRAEEHGDKRAAAKLQPMQQQAQYQQQPQHDSSDIASRRTNHFLQKDSNGQAITKGHQSKRSFSAPPGVSKLKGTKDDCIIS